MIEYWKLHLLKVKRITYLYLQPFSLNHDAKMSRGTLKYMLQMFAVQLKVLLNASSKVIDKAGTFRLIDCLNLFYDGYLQCRNDTKVARVSIVFE